MTWPTIHPLPNARLGIIAAFNPAVKCVLVSGDYVRRDGSMHVSPERWVSFLAAIKADAFTPQIEGETLTITVGDLHTASVAYNPPYLVTSKCMWEDFVRKVKNGEFDDEIPLHYWVMRPDDLKTPG